MKNKFIIYFGFLLLLPFFQSCQEDDEIKTPEFYEITWDDVAFLKFAPSGDSNSFIYNRELGAGGQEYWGVTSLDLNVSLVLGDFPISDISKVDIYVFAEEKIGETYNYLGGSQGKLYATVNNLTETFQLTISKDDLATLFMDDFSPNHNGDVLPDDLFEFKWVITGTDGSVVDTRIDCFDFNCTYSISTKVVDVAPPIWEGTFIYEWIAATPEAESYGKISVGQTGTIDITLQPGSFVMYDVSHAGCDYYYGGPAILDYGYDTGLVEIIDNSWRAQKWDITNINGPTITIDWSYYYSAGYNEYGTFTLTRTDGEDWPTNLYTN